tara:strand:+ start:67 stop:315 length:249 start_codon:yes stop_codon:yes gene_type:complete
MKPASQVPAPVSREQLETLIARQLPATSPAVWQPGVVVIAPQAAKNCGLYKSSKNKTIRIIALIRIYIYISENLMVLPKTKN